MKQNPHSEARISKLGILLALTLCLFGAWLAIASFRMPRKLARSAPQPAHTTIWHRKLPLSFERNIGQTDPNVKFLARGSGYGIYFTTGGAVLSLQSGGATATGQQRPASHSVQIARSQSHQVDFLRMTLVEANREAKVTAVEELAGRANYFIGNDPSKWRTNVPTYAKVKYEGVYPGVTLVYYGNEGQLEYDFVVVPGADPKAIVLDLANQRGNGAEPKIDANGDLIISTGDDEVRFCKPVVYQPSIESSIDGRRSVDARFVLLAANRVGFEIGKYDRSRPLVIDPVLKYSTLYGGSGYDAITSVRVLGSSGETYVTGVTDSFTDFPTNKSLSPHNGSTTTFSNEDAFVAKINADGTGYVWSTYLGGTAQDDGHGIAVDGTGKVYVTGGTNSSDFPMKNAYQDSYPDSGTGEAVFVTKIASDGSSILYSTYLLGYNNNEGHAIAVDDEGNAYVTGYAEGPANGDDAFPQKNGFVTDQCSGYAIDGYNQMSGFIARLDTTQSGDDSLVYSTIFCGYAGTTGFGIATDGTLHSTGNAFVTGVTSWPDFPIKNGFQTSCNGCDVSSFAHEKAFLIKVDTNKSGSASIAYSTFLGGSSSEEGNGIAVDGNGNAYITGTTQSNDFPTTSGALQTTYHGGFDAFVTKIDPGQIGAASLIWSTYLGGSGLDFGRGIALGFGAASGNRDIYVAGITGSSDFPTRNAPQASFAGGADQSSAGIPACDVFVARLKPDGSKLLYSTYLGGSGNEETHVDLFWSSGPSIAVDFSNNVYVAGATTSSDFPVGTAGVNAYLTALQGFADGFITKLTLNPDFSLDAISAMTMNVGSSDSKSVTINSLDSFNSGVTLSAPPPPSGFTTSFNPNPVTPAADDSASSLVMVSAGPAVVAGSYTLNVVGTSGSLTHSRSLSVTVQATPDSVTQVIGADQALGCIDNQGIGNSLTSKLAAAKAYIAAGDIRDAINTLTALLNELQAQAGKHIKTTCTDSNGVTFDPVATLIADVKALLASLGVTLKADPVMGSVSSSSNAAISGATVNILNPSGRVVATASTDAIGFYFFAVTNGWTVNQNYTAKVVLPKGYKTATPVAQTFIWQAGMVTLRNFVLN